MATLNRGPRQCFGWAARVPERGVKPAVLKGQAAVSPLPTPPKRCVFTDRSLNLSEAQLILYKKKSCGDEEPAVSVSPGLRGFPGPG